MSKKMGYVKKTTVNKKGTSIIAKSPMWYSILPWILYPFLLTFFIEALTRGDVLWTFSFVVGEPFYYILNVVLVGLLGGFLWGIIGNKWISLTLLNLLAFFLALVSHIKFAILGTGITLSDIEIFREENLFGRLNADIMVPFFLILIVAIILLYLLIFLMHSFNIGWKKRISGGIILGLVFAVFVQLIMPLINSVSGKVPSVDTLGTAIYFNDRFYLDNAVKPPSQEEVTKAYDGADVKDKKNELQPNVVMVQVSNFWDPMLAEIDGLKDPLPNYRKLLAEGNGFSVDITDMRQSNLNGEYEALTGLSVDNFPYKGQVRGSLVNMPLMSLGSIFRTNGYESHSIMAYKGSDNKREEFYKNLGFNSLTDLDDLTRKNPDKAIDNGLIVKEIGNILNRSSDYPQFVFAHLEGTKPNYLTGSDEEILKAYTEDVAKVDGTIKEIFEMVGKTKTKTIIVFYTEELPVLGKDNKLYETLGYIGDSADLEREIKLNKGSAFIWDNYTKSTASSQKTIEAIDLVMLPEALMTYGAFNMPNYFHYLNSVRTEGEVEAYTSDYLIKDNTVFDKSSETFNQFATGFEVLNDDILSNQYLVEKGSKKWLIEDNSSFY